MDKFPLPSPNYRIGYHYFPDTTHYRHSDIQRWLPILKKLGASWLVLKTPSSRTIPEHFLDALIKENIFPILQFQQPLDQVGSLTEIKLLLETYSRWGVKYIVAFDQPNNQKFWKPGDWAQDALVERFLDRFITVSRLSQDVGILPVFPPLNPGGDYWDLVFLRSSLRGLIQRRHLELIDFLVISAYASSNRRALDWGAGGPSRWTCAHPYYTPPGCQDHRGVNISDWYSPIIKEELGEKHPILLFKMGDPVHPLLRENNEDEKLQKYLKNTLIITKALSANDLDQPAINIQAEVVGGCFSFLVSPVDHSQIDNAQLSLENLDQFAFSRINAWLESQRILTQTKVVEMKVDKKLTNDPNKKTINHYLLLPVYAFGIADWDLDAVRPFIIKNRPTVGFSSDEAINARHVTVLEASSWLPVSILEKLKSAGCNVDILEIDGMNIAP